MVIWISAMCLLSTPAYALDSLPPELMHNGQPIDPLCFEAVSADEWLPLGGCVDEGIVMLDTLPEGAQAMGDIGYYYRYREDTSQTSALPYSFYRYIGQWNGAPVLLTQTSGGGTGKFSALMSIERTGNTIRVLQGFAAGDRCNGGIEDVRLEAGTLYYSQWLVPYDFLQIAEDNPGDLQPYQDLEASAASCVARARYKDGELAGVALESTPDTAEQDLPGWAEKYPYQSCFNNLYRAYLTQGKKELSIQQLKEFTGEFNRLCLPR